MCVDSAGNLWIAIWGGGEVRCYSPTGQQLAVVEVAAPNVTSVAFVGPDLDILLITTASEQLTASPARAVPGFRQTLHLPGRGDRHTGGPLVGRLF